jgi:hypothetical protein
MPRLAVAMILTITLLIIDATLFRTVQSRFSQLRRARIKANVIVITLGSLFLAIISVPVSVAAADRDGYFTLAIWLALITVSESAFVISADLALKAERRQDEARLSLQSTVTVVTRQLQQPEVRGIRRVFLRVQLFLLELVAGGRSPKQ